MTDRHSTDKAFAGSIPELYDTCLVPLIFEPYAVDLASRVVSKGPKKVLEVAAGTGVLTRALSTALPDSTALVATDLNQPMLDRARTVGACRHVEWRQADAMQLPFADGQFDVVVCQFGVMFFPDKPGAFAEARRVLSPGGTFIFNVWDRIEENAFALVVTDALARLYPATPPRFLARTPHGYHDRETIGRDLRLGGFLAEPAFETVASHSRADSARIPSVAYCQGTPLRNELEALGPAELARATDVCTAAMAGKFGPGRVDGKIQAHVVTVEA
ncbi:ubiquinone/menaquinone biosynthesis methyltransferase [Caballeronia glathei]|uniref:class I SAM-dependent methyltransferase n=1 Tax=Caballeronia glathei TaxID=60547 RepID=UPI00050640B6|nr:ubiquinone/menaquinone biosynthesis methyltransferase [Caballeronia glathei]